MTICEYWHEYITIDEASSLGFSIPSFDAGRAWKIDIVFRLDAHEIAYNILREHGKVCDTYKIAKAYLLMWRKLDRAMDEIYNIEEQWANERYDELLEEQEELNREFKHDLGQTYLCMLRSEYEYQTSDEEE